MLIANEKLYHGSKTVRALIDQLQDSFVVKLISGSCREAVANVALPTTSCLTAVAARLRSCYNRTTIARKMPSTDINNDDNDRTETAAANSLRPASQNGSNIPENILNRVNALRSLQLQTITMESELYNKVFCLEQEFAEKLKPLVSKREQIINGTYEPIEDECRCEVELPEECMMFREQNTNSFVCRSDAGDSNDYIKGIPNFWLNVLKNADPITALVQEYDEPVLQYLSNIALEHDKTTENDEIKKFTLVFTFLPNKFFKNDRLTKQYELRVPPSKEEPFMYEGPEIVGCSGCQIDWHPNMNITMRAILPRDSFFNFFSPPAVTKEGDDENLSELDEILEEHYEIGHFMREKLIPNAVLFYTGECSDVISDYDDDDEDEDEFDEDGDRQINRDARVSTDSRTDQNEQSDQNNDDSDENTEEDEDYLRRTRDAVEG
ncbi:hypothetical protein GJ496_007852 [Pomphorhynchus laevis]|nr:hypothetical protein GJ496_007852 [Pomphorhynchus laevis]